MDRARPARPRVARQDGEDRAALALLDHLPAGGAGAEEAAVEDDPDHGAPAARREVLGLDDEVAGGVVDEHVDTAEALHRVGDERVDLVGVANVGRLRVTRSAVVLDLGDRLLERLRPAPAHDHGRAEPGELERHRPAHPAAAAGDDRHLALERALSKHRRLLLLSERGGTHGSPTDPLLDCSRVPRGET